MGDIIITVQGDLHLHVAGPEILATLKDIQMDAQQALAVATATRAELADTKALLVKVSTETAALLQKIIDLSIPPGLPAELEAALLGLQTDATAVKAATQAVDDQVPDAPA